jgi:DNA-binding response OmpR family regulator
LVVDDESHIRTALVKALSIIGYCVEEAASGAEAVMLMKHSTFDLMILDMLMPNMGGEEVLQQVNRMQSDLSIIVLTGNATLDNAIAAIKSGVVDYLRKPTRIHDIVDAVTKALQKRISYSQKNYLIDELGLMLEKEADILPNSGQLVYSMPSRFVFSPPLRLDCSKRQLTCSNDLSNFVKLSKGETAVLACLMRNSSKALSCSQLVQMAWGYKLEKYEAENVIRPYISRLRGKIERNPQNPSLIHTIRGQGYQFFDADDKKHSY